jgi:hypothetical protein
MPAPFNRSLIQRRHSSGVPGEGIHNVKLMLNHAAGYSTDYVPHEPLRILQPLPASSEAALRAVARHINPHRRHRIVKFQQPTVRSHAENMRHDHFIFPRLLKIKKLNRSEGKRI